MRWRALGLQTGLLSVRMPSSRKLIWVDLQYLWTTYDCELHYDWLRSTSSSSPPALLSTDYDVVVMLL
jgi:hypothetical protein